MPSASEKNRVSMVFIENQRSWMEINPVTMSRFRLFHGLPSPQTCTLFGHLWDQRKYQIQQCNSEPDLEVSVQYLSAHLPQDNIRCLISSMPGNVEAYIEVRGGLIPY
ncbi:hypothetical protein TNIN_467091 [Trichonephila inaurata madagascariensis]|uniref:Uncharacterized protein n=1 Tax=Trichonephila inaurata madagascariensis TaxID=2747483 RepID=A0A8X6X8Q2_9ARAC|nr:hypothetical protein TNIN_467091 [Trichonephila inaurata madagascariensis]